MGTPPKFKLIDFQKAKKGLSKKKAKSLPAASLNDTWDESVSFEAGEAEFYDVTGFPKDKVIWDAYLKAQQSYFLNVVVDEDYKGLLFNRNVLFPTEVLSDHGQVDFDETHHSVETIISASLLWRSVAQNPELRHDLELMNSGVLDICDDLIDYYSGGASIEEISEEAQAIVTSIQICDIAEVANIVDNWALKLQKHDIEANDLLNAKALHQKVLMERWIDPDDGALDALLIRELGRLSRNIADDRAVLDGADRRKALKLIK